MTKGEARSRDRQQHILGLLLSLGLWGAIALPALADGEVAGDADESPVPLRPKTSCPEDLPTLMAGLLRDLPSYANRVAMRTLGTNPSGRPTFGTVLVAGQPEFEPLALSTLGAEIPTAIAPTNPIDSTVHQVFFTTWERQYTATDIYYLEQYHWLFLSRATDGWRLSLLFSRLGLDADTVIEPASLRSPSPPQESSDGIVGQAVRLWLRDCRAGAIAPIAVPGSASEAVSEPPPTGQ